MKILNLYAGIGGNRKLWGNEHDITAVEYNPDIAKIYQDFFPSDKVIVTDAHEYLLEHFKEYDFIWSSPPCPTHSDIRRMAVQAGDLQPKYPEMSLYQEIILLQTFFKGSYCVENVKPYYKPLIPAQERDRHLFWANFYITEYGHTVAKHNASISQQQKILDVDLTPYKNIDKRQILRNCVLPEVGKHILDCFTSQQRQLL